MIFTVAPRPNTAPYWAAICLVLTLGYCILLQAWVNQAKVAYADERANDIIYQQNAQLRREWLYMFIIQQMMIEDQKAAPHQPKPKYAY